MSRDLIARAVDTFAAIDVLKLSKSKRLVSVSGGIEIHQPGKPVLLLTHAAAEAWAKEVAEASA